MQRITTVCGDITEQNVDAIVNAANSAMRGGGGVDGAIHRAGGPAILQDCIARFPDGLAVGDAGWTTAGRLPARSVIHTVGPNYAAGQRDRTLLESCYRRALEVADEIDATSVAFPLIGAGVFGWPMGEAITAALYASADATTRVDEVKLVAFDDKTLATINFRLLVATPIRILQGVRVLHRRGYHQVRVRPGMAPSGGYWRVAISTADTTTPAIGSLKLPHKVSEVLYTSGAQTDFNGGYVSLATKPDDVADLILTGLPEARPNAGDPEYVAWYAELMTLVEQAGMPPISYAEYFDAGRGWQIDGSDDLFHPHPPPRPTTGDVS